MFGILGGIIAIAIAIAVVGTIAIKHHLSSNEKMAVRLAQEYLAQKYEQEMQFYHVRFSWIDPSLYQVTFTPADNPNLYFQVIVQQNLTIAEGLQEFGYSTYPDNYYLNYFTFHTSRAIEKDVQNIWDESASVHVSIDSPALYSYRMPTEFNEHMSAEEMAPFLNYDYHITLNRLLDSRFKTEEAEKILQTISVFQISQYDPREILFWYQTGKNAKQKVLTDSKTWPEMYIKFENWSEISTIDEVVQAMDEQWFNKFNN